jgi:hypothetical protein
MLDLSVGMRVCHGNPVDADAIGFAEFEEAGSRKLCPIVSDDGVRGAVAMDDVEDERDGLGRHELRHWLSLDPLGELVNRHEQVSEASWGLLEGPDHIQTLDSERLGDQNGLEGLRWQVGLSGIELIPFAGADDFFRIGHDGGPVEALAEGFSDQCSCGGVMTANPGVDLLQDRFAAEDTLLQDPARAAFVEEVIDDNERLSSVCGAPGLGLVGRELSMPEEI